jgi:hypothetical protein
MTTHWQYQLRLYLSDDLAEAARHHPDAPELRSLNDTLDACHAVMVSQLDAFESYVRAAEAGDPASFPLYKWTQATLQEPEKRRKHLKAFALRVSGQEVYPKNVADMLEAAVKPLIDGRRITHMTRHDTNPANNLPIPPEHRP